MASPARPQGHLLQPLGFVPASPVDASPTKSTHTKIKTEQTWIGAIALIGGKWLQCTRVEWNSQKPADSLVHFVSDSEVARPDARLKLSILTDGVKRGAVCTRIILKAASGTFTNAAGVSMKVAGFTSRSGKIAAVKANAVDDDGDIISAMNPIPIGAFISDWVDEPSPAGGGQPASFDFAPYPTVVKALRYTKQLSSARTAMAPGLAARVLQGLRGGNQPIAADQLSAVAALAEAALQNKEKASPCMKRLRAVVELSAAPAGEAGAHASGQVIRSFAMRL